MLSPLKNTLSKSRQDFRNSWSGPSNATVNTTPLSSYGMVKAGPGTDIFHFTNTDSNEVRYTLRSTTIPARIVVHGGSSLDNAVMAIAHYKSGNAPRIDINSTGSSQDGSRVDVRVMDARRSVRSLTNDCTFAVPSSGLSLIHI